MKKFFLPEKRAAPKRFFLLECVEKIKKLANLRARTDARPPAAPCNAMSKSIAHAGCVSSAAILSLILSSKERNAVFSKNKKFHNVSDFTNSTYQLIKANSFNPTI